MNLYYQAFINFITSKGATRDQFESELLNAGTSVEDFITTHLTDVDYNYFDSIWLEDISFFSFNNSLEGREFWGRVFHATECLEITIEDFLKPYMQPPSYQ